MNIQELFDLMKKMESTIATLTNRVAVLERQRIQVNIDPVIQKYLDDAVGRQIYGGTTAPTGTNFPIGSLYFQDDAVLANRKLFMYISTGWQQIK